MLTEVSLEYSWTPLLEHRSEEVDEILASIDPDQLPTEVQADYWGLVTIRQMWTGDVEAAVARRQALRDEMADTGDSQAMAAVQRDLVDEDVLMGRFAEAYDRAERELPPSPVRLDLWFRTNASILMHDRERISATGAAAEENRYRGRYADLLEHASRGALAALDGALDEGALQWTRTADLAEEAFPLGLCAYVWALAGVSLGLDHPVGRELGRKAYDAWSAVGATTMLEVFHEGVLAPEPASESTRYA